MDYSKGIKFRLYPTKVQIDVINKHFNACRFVYNHFLDVRQKAYNENKETLNYYACCKLLTALKQDGEHLWLYEVSNAALQNSLRDLDRAYQNFFAHRGRYPKFKSRYNNVQSFRLQNGNKEIRVEDGGRVRLPKIGTVRVRPVPEFAGRILNATVSRTATGKYFISLCVKQDIELGLNDGGTIGLHFGLRDFYTDDKGNKIDNPKVLARYEKKLARAQRKLSRRKKGSSNRNKQRLVVARIHERIANIRKDFLHKLSLQVVEENSLIAVRDLETKRMLKDPIFAKGIGDASWSEFVRQLQYKSFLHGGTVVKIPTEHPSVQLCSVCGYQNEAMKDLRIREWVCPQCGAHHERGENAAVNILNEALKLEAQKV